MSRDRVVFAAVIAFAMVVMLAIPVGPHDWGDDFALYIMQAADFTGQHGFRGLFVPNDAYDSFSYSPTSYPPGFPALLAPIYAIWGIDLPAMQIYMSVLLVLMGAATYRYALAVLKERPLAFAVAAIVTFHVTSLDLKQFILSDIPFTLLVLLFLDSVERQGPRIVPMLAAVSAWLIRTAGAVVILAWLADALIGVLVRRGPRGAALHNLGMAVATALVMRVLSILVTDTQGYVPDPRAWLASTGPADSLRVYRGMFEYYFGALFGFAAAPLVLPIVLLLFAAGVILAVREGRQTGLWFFAGHSALLIVYPYHLGGFRMILPLVPLLWIHAARGGLAITGRLTASRLPQYAACALLLLLTARQIHAFSTRTVPVEITPESAEAQELFAQMRTAIPAEALTVSAKPRALALFTGRRGSSVQPAASPDTLDRFIRDHDVTFVICGTPFKHAALDAYCQSRVSPPAFRNSAFAVYRTGP